MWLVRCCFAGRSDLYGFYTASIIVGLAAQQAGHPDLIRPPKRALAHLWEENEL